MYFLLPVDLFWTTTRHRDSGIFIVDVFTSTVINHSDSQIIDYCTDLQGGGTILSVGIFALKLRQLPSIDGNLNITILEQMFVTIGQSSPTPKSVKNARNVPYFDRFWRG